MSISYGYMSTKEKNKNLQTDILQQNNNMRGLYNLDFSKPHLCERTYPVACVINGTELFGRSWAQLLAAITEKFIADNNPSIAILYEQPIYQGRSTRPFIMKNKIEGLNCSQLSNGYWINVNYSIPRLIEIIGRLCAHCGVGLSDVKITYAPKSSGIYSSEMSPVNKYKLDLYNLDFTKPQLCERTYPVSCVINGTELFGRSWAQLLAAITEKFIADNNPSIAILYEQPLYQGRSTRPFIMKNKIEGLNCSQLSNGYWINVNYSIPRLIEIIGRLCAHCGVGLSDVKITYAPKSSDAYRSEMQTVSIQKSSIYDHNFYAQKASINDKNVNEFVYKKGLKGTTVNEISVALDVGKQSTIIRLLDNNTDVIAFPRGRYIHKDNVVDLGEAANVLLRILQAQFCQFDGYSNSRLLFDAARIELSLFMNDNAFDDEETIYAIAKHLFCKKKYKGNDFIFSGNIHIWEKAPDYPMNIRGILMHQARLNDGKITKVECEEFLNRIKISPNNISQAIKCDNDFTFYQYDSDVYLLSEILHIDTEWKERVKQALDELFKDNEFVIPRDIMEGWYNKLPELPLGFSWTTLLLQEVLKYNPDIGYKSVFAPLEQSSDTIAAAIVPIDSDIMFADVVSTYLCNKIELPKRMSAEDLRLILREAGMINGNELIYNMHKVLDDYRFAWSDSNKLVYIIMG